MFGKIQQPTSHPESSWADVENGTSSNEMIGLLFAVVRQSNGQWRDRSASIKASERTAVGGIPSRKSPNKFGKMPFGIQDGGRLSFAGSRL